MLQIEYDILNGNYWELFKYGKDLSLLYTPEHPKRIEVQNVLNDLTQQLQELKSKLKINT